jgi:uncharacterized protein YbaP (TraB family)
MKIIFIFLFVFFLSHLFGQETEMPAMGSVFWKISSTNNKEVSYLFGTIHLIDQNKYILPKIVSKRLAKSDLLIMEIADMDNQSGMLEMITLKEGRMTDVLNPDQKDSLYSYTDKKFGLDSSMFESLMGKFKPIFFLQLPYAPLVLKSESYDLNINKIARLEGIKIQGLETAEEQLGYFDNLSNEIKAEMIMHVVRDTSNLYQVWDDLQEMYLKQQVSDMVTLNTGSADIVAFYEKTLSSDRNKKWVVTLTKYLDEKSVFIAVGAGHLPGKDGLINLLQKEGYTVSPVQIKLK